MDLKAPGHPLVPPLPNWTTWGPCPAHWSKDRGLLVASSWPVLGMSEQPPQARARKVQDSKRKSGHPAAAAELAHRGLPLGRGLRRAAALGASSLFLPARGRRAFEISRAMSRRGGRTACSSVADARAYLASASTSPQPSPRQPPPPAWHHVKQSSQITGRDLCRASGGKAEPGRLCSEA